MIPGLSGPFPPPVAASGISFNHVGNFDSASSLTTYTSGSLTFSSGYSHVIIGCGSAAAANRSLSSGTLNSVAHTDVVTTSGAQGCSGHLVFAHPGAGSFSFTATFSGAMLRAGFTVMECNITSGTPVSTGTDTTATTNKLQAFVTPDVTAPYLMVGMSFNNASSVTNAWTASTGETMTELSDTVFATSRTYSMAAVIAAVDITGGDLATQLSGTASTPSLCVGIWQ